VRKVVLVARVRCCRGLIDTEAGETLAISRHKGDRDNDFTCFEMIDLFREGDVTVLELNEETQRWYKVT
jgi:hypothetical protein